jgi:hypothetical protein
MPEGTQGNSGDAGAGGGNAGGNAGALTLDAPFDMGLIPEADRAVFGDAKFTKLGEVVNYAREASQRAAAGGKLTLDAKLDPALFAPDYQKIFGAKKIETVQALADMAVSGEKFIGSMGSKPLAAPEPGKLVDFFTANAEVFAVPKTPDQYEWNKPQMPDGFEFDDATDKAFREFAHKRGIPGELYQDMADFGAKLLIDRHTAMQNTVALEETAARDALKTEWGADAAKNTEVAQFAARQLGLDAALVDRVNAEIGAPGLIKLLHQVGAKMEGASMITGDGKSALTSKADAQAKLDAMQKDAATTAILADRTHAQHKNMVEQREQLMKIVHS